jgi:uncharacterized protein YjbI with pentapeptide repeats
MIMTASITAVVALIVIGLIAIRRSKSSKIQGKERHDLVLGYGDLVLKVVGFAAVVAGLAYTLRTIEVSQENTNLTQKSFDNTLKIQAVERYAKAVEQLASDSETQRIGGIDALKSLLDNPDHHRAVVDLLSSFVRNRAKPPGDRPKPTIDPCQGGRPMIPAPPDDVQKALTVLVQRDTKLEAKNYRVDLSGAYLAGISLVDADLRNFNLSGVDFTGAQMNLVHLDRAILHGTRFSYACLVTAHMTDVELHNAFLDHALLGDAELHNASFFCVVADGANFRRARLGEVEHAPGINEPRPGARMMGVQLRGGDLSEADTRGSILDGVDLTDTSVRATKFHGVDLSHVNGLSDEMLRTAETDAATKLPDRSGNWTYPGCRS